MPYAHAARASLKISANTGVVSRGLLDPVLLRAVRAARNTYLTEYTPCSGKLMMKGDDRRRRLACGT